MFKKIQELSAPFNGASGAEDTTESVIGPSVHLEGNFNSSGNIVVVGSLTGSLTTSGNVRVEEGAKVQASVSATNVFVAGEMRGDIHITEQLELSPSARVIGNVQAKILSVSPGAILHGKCMMKNGEAKIAIESVKKNKTTRGAKVEEVVMAEVGE